MKRIAILGSTGSIGVSALDVLSSLKDDFRVVALSADSNAGLLASQASRFRPKIVSIGSAALASNLSRAVGRGTKVVFGADGLNEIASAGYVDIVLFAISGSSCIGTVIKAIERGKRIALANKESLVSAGSVIMRKARANKVDIIPIDSEHSAIFQCLNGKREFLKKIYLTGSGGPLLDLPRRRFDALPSSFILNHPKWRMGKKISVDSATMMNKGLEIIEARWLFDVDEKNIEVLVHPEAVVHSMVEFVDGAVLAQMGVPDMRAPIQYAITYPSRRPSPAGRVDFKSLGSLTFRAPDTGKFPCLGLARSALRQGGTAPAALNAANEEAVRCFLSGGMKFSRIPAVIERVLSRHKNLKAKEPSLADITASDDWARCEARSSCCR